MMRKLAEYEQMGISNILIIDPNQDHIPQLLSRFRGGKLEAIEEGVTQLAATPCSIDWQQLRELLD